MNYKTLISALFFCIIFLKGYTQPAGCTASSDPAGNTGQTGLYAEYYTGYFADNPSYFTANSPTLTRIETTINFTTNNWGLPVPPFAGSAADQNTYSARYRGSIYIATAGTYTFSLASDDASYLFIDNDALTSPTVISTALINNGGAHGTTTVTASIFLSAGLHNIQILYGEDGGGNYLTFSYASTTAGITNQIVPSSILCTGVQPAIVITPPPPPPGCTGNDPGGSPASAGLYAEFYSGYFNDNQSYFNTNSPGLTRIDNYVNYNTDGGWGNIVPPGTGSSANPDTYSTRWTGSIYIETAGTYTFSLLSDDAAYIWIDTDATVVPPVTANALINNGGLHSANTVSATVSLNAGLHPLRIHYGENGGDNVCVLQYSSSTLGITTQPVPIEILCTSISSAPLPVELLSFTVSTVDAQTYLLNWSTATESNSDFFELQRGIDGENFIPIGQVTAAGNSVTLLNYSFTDHYSGGPVIYYRLKQVDQNGDYKYYGPIAIEKHFEENELQVYPNPSDGTFTISCWSSSLENPAITITDVSGRVVYTKNLSSSTKELKLSTQLPSGVYFLSKTTGNHVVTKKLVIH